MCHCCNYAELLESNELSSTPNRLMVLEIIGNSRAPLTPQEILTTLKRSQRINRVTLYRILDLLVEKKLLERISAGDRTFRYGLAPNANHPRHPHFFCSNCGNMECMEPGSLAMDIEALQKTFPALIEKVEVRVDGICRNCLRQQQRQR